MSKKNRIRPLSFSLRPLVALRIELGTADGSNGATLAQTLSVDARLAVPGPSAGWPNPSAKFHDFIILRRQRCCSPAYLTRHCPDPVKVEVTKSISI